MRRRLPAAALALLCACGDTPGEGPNAAMPAQGSAMLWSSLGSWSGRGNRQTESFDVTSGALRLAWEAADIDPAAPEHLRVSIHSAISGRPLHTVVDTREVDADTVRFPADPRVAHLIIESEGVEWRLTLQEGAVAPAAAPTPEP